MIVVEEEISVTLFGELEGTTKCMTNEEVLSKIIQIYRLCCKIYRCVELSIYIYKIYKYTECTVQSIDSANS